MRMRLIGIIVAALSAAPIITQAQRADSSATAGRGGLSDAEVAAAIDMGHSGNGPFGFYESKGILDVIVSGPVARIATLAARARQKYLPFSPESVGPVLRAPLLIVTARPKPTIVGRERIDPRLVHIVIQGRAPNESEPTTIQPTKIDTVPRTWTNGFGAQFVVQDFLAYFDPGPLAPLQDIVIVVVTNEGEFRIKVKDKDRDRLR